MATKTAMHQDIRSLFQTGSEATVRRPLVLRATAAALVSRRNYSLARYVRHSLAKVLEQQLITRLWPWQSGYLDISPYIYSHVILSAAAYLCTTVYIRSLANTLHMYLSIDVICFLNLFVYWVKVANSQNVFFVVWPNYHKSRTWNSLVIWQKNPWYLLRICNLYVITILHTW